MFVAAISSMLLGVAGAPIELLKRIPLFSDLNGRELRAVADSMRERTFEAGSSVLQEGKSGVGFFVVEAGKARVSIGGRETNVLGAGDYFGEIAVIGGVDRTATITAESDLHCYGMTPWDFRPLVASNASIAWKLLQALARRVSVAEQGRD